MKNPFVIAALMATAMSAAFRENVARSMPGYRPTSGGQHGPRVPGKRNPAGSKIARKWAKHQGHEWKGEIVHGGDLPPVNRNAISPDEYRREVAYDNDEISDARSTRHYPSLEGETA